VTLDKGTGAFIGLEPQLAGAEERPAAPIWSLAGFHDRSTASHARAGRKNACTCSGRREAKCDGGCSFKVRACTAR